MDNGGVRLLQLVSVKIYEYGLEVVDKLVNPRQVQEGTVDGLELQCEWWDLGQDIMHRQLVTYNKDDAQFLHKGPFKSMLVVFVGGVVCRRLVVLCAGRGGFLLDKDIGDEIIDDGRAHGRIGSRPQHHARGGQNLKGI